MRQELKLIGVGASAGGLDALIDFFKNVPGDCDRAFLVIQHLSPDHASIMDELLAPHAKLPVVKAADGMLMEGGSIYLCPPGVIPRVNGLILSLEDRPKDQSMILPINILFDSIGRTLGPSGAAVVLSGTGSDGSLGIQAVEQRRGLVAVQSPETADYAGMPQSAISTGKCHIVAPAGKLWDEMRRYNEGKDLNLADGVPELTSGNEPVPFEPEDCVKIFDYLEGEFGLDFSLYRISSVGRRLNRRMGLLAIPDIQSYLKYLEQNENEAQCLYTDLLIGVTEFFRDTDSFALLSREAIKSVMTAKRDQDFRIWSAGCATGAEAYSLYILADEVRREVGFSGRITVFATDVFKPSIDVAGKGLYRSEKLAGLSHDRLERYFQVVDQGFYKIQPHARENIIFAQHNFLTDAPFSNMDIVSCRNVLIYLKPETQETALGAFSYALKDDGFLFLGGSESLGQFEKAFKVISEKAKVYQKHSGQLDAKRWPKMKATSTPKAKKAVKVPAGASVTINRDLLSAYDSLLNRFAPCGFLINANREVLHYFGDASDYCVHVAGRATADLSEQLDEPLRLALHALMHRVKKQNERAGSKGLRCASRSGSRVVDIAVEPLKDTRGECRNYLIEIDGRKQEAATVEESVEQDPETDGRVLNAGEQIKLLEDELKVTRENLEAANEELQVSNEELQATNEELQVSNEELQSTNEELHSLNEELTTLNAEYERKNYELVEVNTSHENLLESTEDGVLYVDKDLRIRQFNSSIKSAFSLMPGDIGRLLQDIAYHMEDAGKLIDEVQSVLKSGERIEQETGSVEGRFYMKRITPYRGQGGEIDGVLLTFTDVTEVRRMEKRFKFALESATLSWWDWDLADGIVSVTSGGECLLGDDCLCMPKDRMGWMEMVHPDDRADVRRSLDDCLEGRTKEWRCDHRFRTDSDDWLWVCNQGIVTKRDAAGKPLEMMGTTQNVDTYKRAVVEAGIQKDILDATDEISKVGAWEYHPETDEVIWSEEIRKILEVDEDFVASAENTFKFMPPDDRERLESAFRQINLDGTPYDLQLHFRSAKGRDLLCRAAGRASFDDKGNITHVYGIFQDVTELTLLQQELEAFFHLSPDFQAVLTLDGTFKYWSPSWERELGYSKNELSSMHVSDLVTEADRSAFRRKLNEVVGGDSMASYETRVISRNSAVPACAAKEPWISWSCSFEPELSLVFVSARCVTEQKDGQLALQEARVKAEEANRAKSDFLGVMSHELRTPLNPILGFTDMLMEDAQSEEQKDILKTITESGNHMLSLIDEILEYSKIDAGKATVEPTEFLLEDFVEQKVHLMSGQIKDAPITLKGSIDWGPVDETRFPIFAGDVGMIRQVGRNLISNAIKFTKEGEVSFDVSIRELEGDRALVRFDVKDTGIGIAEEDFFKLFNPFTQVQSGTTREYGGTGLGLAICKRLVELMDGTINVESVKGEGSTFTFTLPLTLRYDKGAVCQSREQDVSEPLLKKKLKGSVLLVEDNESNAYYIKTLIDMRGAKVKLAVDGEAALDQLRREDFDLVLLDLHMPGIGGVETLKHIRSSKQERLRNLPVFILTADASDGAKQECQKNGSNGFLIKPVRPREVDVVLDEVLKEA